MINYKKLAEEALKKANKTKLVKTLNENLVYPEGLTERMHPSLEEDLVKKTHSLGKHPIFPDDDESTFEQKIMGKRFDEVVKRYKRAFDVDSIDNRSVMTEMMPLLNETMKLESSHKKALEKLAEEMIREEYDMGKDIVEIKCELTNNINTEGLVKNPKPMPVDIEFKNHDEMVNANEEVYKRRFLNAMTQGAAKKVNHMFHMVDEEITDLDPKLLNRYTKLMAAADYVYYIVPKMEDGVVGGIVRVEFPSEKNPKAVIHAQAMVFPVLIHELVKGVMELLSAHGLPQNKRISKYVVNKADFTAAEPWDMRLGPAIWERFTESIDPDDFKLKHHVYSELASLPVREFNTKMREIMAGTKEGKKIIEGILSEVKNGLQEDEFNEAMNEIISSTDKFEESTDDSYDFDDLMKGGKEDDKKDDEGYDFDELFDK
jgi:hypothetical protein